MNEGKYDQVTKTMTPTSTNTANLSLQERLSALTKVSFLSKSSVTCYCIICVYLSTGSLLTLFSRVPTIGRKE